MPVADRAHARHELARRDLEAALALDGLDHDRRDGLGRDLGHQGALERGERLDGVRAAVPLGERHAVDLRRERAEPGLVRVRLRGERERQERAAVEAALEGDHCGPLGVRARELDRVLDRLGARVEERRPGRPRDRSKRAEALRQRDVDLVRDDGEVGVAEVRKLLLGGLDDPRVRVADVEAADAAGEVDERVAVDVGQGRPAALRGHDGQVDRQRLGDHLLLAREDLPGPGPRDFRAQLDRLRRRHRGGR
jgi:hypothetical protein